MKKYLTHRLSDNVLNKLTMPHGNSKLFKEDMVYLSIPLSDYDYRIENDFEWRFLRESVNTTLVTTNHNPNSLRLFKSIKFDNKNLISICRAMFKRTAVPLVIVSFGSVISPDRRFDGIKPDELSNKLQSVKETLFRFVQIEYDELGDIERHAYELEVFDGKLYGMGLEGNRTILKQFKAGDIK